MATNSSEQTFPLYADFEAVVEQTREAGDKLVASGRKLTTAYLDGIEKYVGGVAQFQRKLSEQIKVEPFAGVLNAQAKLTEDLTSVGVVTARELIAA
jgi:hypothetical protein